MDASDSDSDLSFLSSPTVRLNTEEESKRREEEKVKEGWKEVTGLEWEEDEESVLPLSIPQNANEAEAEIPTASLTSAVEVNEVEAEAFSKDKGKGLMIKEDEERILDDLKVKIPAAFQIQKDEALALQLHEQLNKEEEEEREQKRKEEAKFRITDSKLAKEMREEWIEALVSQGEDAYYLEKLSNKEIYRAFMGQQGLLANKKRAEEEEKSKQKSKKTIAFNKRSHEERKVMIDFLKARGESGKRLGPMSFMNMQALYFKVKKEEKERLRKKCSKKRVINQEEERKPKKPKPSLSFTTSSIQQPSSLHPRPPSSPPTKSKSSHPAPTHQQPPKKKRKPTTKPEDSGEIVNWFYSTQDQRFEVFKGRTEERRSIYTTVDEVLQLPDSDLRRIMELSEANEPENEGGRHLLLVIKHHFNPRKDEIIDAKPLQSHSPFINCSYNAEKD
ncbi:hypothetical protein L1987_76417 [Smallanthus sonchifolius]|uniref:Uncharacterized protein n=1 Tax=Smallanthus sonchifolius TaxID=185202 RepID=A0ACB9A844_9ASTR|nr:hypothetical protein L1987_76417 [Smallanthus sonchifolius]